MADAEKSDQPQTNGVENGLDEDERSKLRPADIDADVKEMERRKRVEMIMGSRLFREELERIIELQMKDGNGPAGLLQQISDMMGIHSGKLHTAQYMFRGSNCVTPINDIRGVESMGYEKGEKNLRCKLASVFRLMDLYGWSQGLNNQISARLNQDEEHFLVNPHGMLFNEITASSLVKVDMQGNIVEPGTTNFSIHNRGFLLHSAIHSSRPDVNCVIHIKTPSVLAVSSLKCGLLPLCHESLVIGEVSQHPFVTGIYEPEELEKIIRNLGPSNKVLLLHNHGAVCCGATVEEAFYNAYNTVLACETQIKLMPIGVENLILVNDETRKQVYDAAHRNPDGSVSSDKKAKQFRVGELEFEALIRMLDNAGFRTGYIYRHPLIKGDLPKPKNDVEVPPAVSSLGYLIEQEELYKQGNWKKYVDGRNRLDRTKWLNSPNVYQKVEILETGTSDPKKITKWVDQNSEEWVAESSPTHSSTPVKIDSALQFVPKGTNPKEFKKLQQQIKENRRADKITSGPQSHILEGVSWEEAKKLQDANITQTGDQVILVGAASKGIIQRNYQHHALVYKTPYAKNPFDSMSDKEIEDYKQLVERKERGDTDYEGSQSESEAVSSRQDALRHIKSPVLSPHSASSETEEESRDEPRVLRIETKTAPRPIQAEVVLSDAESDSTDARVGRSHSARYPKAEKPESVNLMNSFRKSWSLKREKDKSKDVSNAGDQEPGNLHQTHLLNDCERGRMDPLHYCIARIKQLTYEPVIVDLNSSVLHSKLKSVSDPCNLNRAADEETGFGLPENGRLVVSRDQNTSLSCNNIVSDLQRRLNIRKKLIYSAKMKFLGFNNESMEPLNEKASTSPMRALISEIRETINEIMSPERNKKTENPPIEEYLNTLRFIERPKFRRFDSGKLDLRSDEIKENDRSSGRRLLCEYEEPQKMVSMESLRDFKDDFKELDKVDDEGDGKHFENDVSETDNDELTIRNNKLLEKSKVDENENVIVDDETVENVSKEPLETVNVTDEEGTYTVTEDSMLPTYSFTETTETEWYYNKTIMKLENSQTVVEIKDFENKENVVNRETPMVRNTDTGIDTDFTSEKENEDNLEGLEGEKPSGKTEDADIEKAAGESSALNKSSETESSILKSSSGGYTSNDIDTSAAFKTETESSEKINEISKLSVGEEDGKVDKKEKKNVDDKNECRNETVDGPEKNLEIQNGRLPDIPESPEFMNVDTEDAPVTSSSKNTSPEILNVTEEEPLSVIGDGEHGKNAEGKKEDRPEPKPEKRKRKRNKKSSTKITVKKELKEKNSVNPVVKEIKLTIKNSKECQSEKYEVKIQDVTNTSEELSSSVGENVDSFGMNDVNDSSCDCEAQQSLEKLQGEISSTIEKLHTIEDYFEYEIQKHTTEDKVKKIGAGELTIEYNYGEVEDVPNECKRDKTTVTNADKSLDLENILQTSTGLTSSTLNSSDQGIDISENGEAVEFHCQDVSLISIISKTSDDYPPLDFENPKTKDKKTTPERKTSDDDAMENLCVKEGACAEPEHEIKELIDTNINIKDYAVEGNNDDKLEEINFINEYGVSQELDKNLIDSDLEKINDDLRSKTNEGIFIFGETEENLDIERTQLENEIFKPMENSECEIEEKKEEEEDGSKVHSRVLNITLEEANLCEYLNWILNRLTSPLKAVEWGESNYGFSKKDLEPVELVLNEILAAATKMEAQPFSRVMNFILGNEESPTDSLAEFEDMENLISTSSSIVAEIIDSIESQLEDRENNGNKSNGGPKRSKDSMFKVVVKTPTKKEIFINYSQNSSSSFDLSSDFELCNSYVKTDEVNEDFENYSSDNSCFFSMESSNKNSPNSSYGSIESGVPGFSSKGGSFCCVERDGDSSKNSPRSLSIIQEVDEGGESTGENTVNGDQSDAHQSTFSHSSKEGSPTKDRSTEDSSKKDKKKKKGLRTPSFLKKKKEKKKIAESA